MRQHLDLSREVKIPRTKLIEKMKENRAQHAETYEQAMDGYRRKVVEVLQSALYAAQAVKEKGEGVASLSQITRLTKPSEYLQAYDEAIELFEWDQRETLKLSVEEFRKYVLDKWDWKDSFEANSTAYLVGKT